MVKCFYFFLFFAVTATIEAADQQFSENHKQLIEELVALTGEMDVFKQKVRDYYHEPRFFPVDKMFKGSILENDPEAVRVIGTAIDSVLDKEFSEGTALKNVHYQSFGTDITEQELAVLIEFYRTDIGKKVLDSNAGVFEEWEKNRNLWALSLSSAVRKNVKRRLKEYHARKLNENNQPEKNEN